MELTLLIISISIIRHFHQIESEKRKVACPHLDESVDEASLMLMESYIKRKNNSVKLLHSVVQ